MCHSPRVNTWASKRQRATWELGAMLHQNKSRGAALIKPAKAICSHAITEAKTNYQAAIMEAKMTKHHLIQAAKVIVPKPSVTPRPRQLLRL